MIGRTVQSIELVSGPFKRELGDLNLVARRVNVGLARRLADRV